MTTPRECGTRACRLLRHRHVTSCAEFAQPGSPTEYIENAAQDFCEWAEPYAAAARKLPYRPKKDKFLATRTW